NISTMLDEIAQLVEITPRDRRGFLQNMNENGRYSSVLLRNNLTEIEASWFAAHAWRFPTVDLSARWVREYPHGESAAHVLGYVGRISEADLQRLEEEGQVGNYRGTQVIGKQGIEKTWEE